ncbi:MAG: hypothetical protein K0R09_2765 [Clostridiales bacterium]|nr:hypothetical protein [Clostridiales bacterium]
MKKIVILLLIFTMLLATGCPGGETPKSNDNKTEVKKIDEDAAKEFMDNYMRYKLSGNNLALNSFYSDEIKEKTSSVPETRNPGPVGFKLEEGEAKEEKLEFKAHIYSASTETPYFSDDTYKYTIKLEKGKMMIDKIEKEKSIELFSKENTIYKREGDKVEGEPVITLEDLPLFTTPKGAGEGKYNVPRSSFGPCAISPNSKSFIVSSSGEDNGFIADIKMKDSEEAVSLQGGEGDKQKQGGGGQQAGGSQTEGQGQPKKSNANISLKPIDLYLNTKITGISFAPNGKMLAVEIIPPGGLTRVNLYKGENWEQIKSDIDKHFVKDRFSVKNPYFVEDSKMVFTVEPIKDATSEEQTLKGEWVYDVKGDKVVQIK